MAAGLTPTEVAQTDLSDAPPPLPVGRGTRALAGSALSQALGAMRGESQEASSEARERIEESRPAIQGIIDDPVTHAPAPTLEDIPETPSQTPTGTPARVFSQFLPVVAMFGGAFVKGNATAALQAGTAAMRAARARDEREVQRATKQWELNIQRITAGNAQKLQQYQAVLADTRMTLDERAAALTALAAQEDNALRLAQIASGQLAELERGVQMEMNATEQLRAASDRSASLAIQRAGLPIANQIYLDWKKANPDATPTQAVDFVRGLTEATRRGASLQRADATTRAQIDSNYDLALASARAIERMEAGGNRPFAEGFGPTARGLIGMDDPNKPGLGDWLARGARAAAGDEFRNYETETRSFLSGVIAMFAGKAQTQSEVRNQEARLIPSETDTGEQLAIKARNRASLMNALADMSGRERPYPDIAVESAHASIFGGAASAPGAPSLPVVHNQAEYDALAPGTRYRNEAGETGVKR